MGNHAAGIIFYVVAMAFMAKAAIGAEAVKLRYIQSLYVDSRETGLKFPEGVGCDDKNQVVVADSGNGRLVRFTISDGRATPEKEIKVPELPFPIRVHVNSKGEILALDGLQKRVVRLGPSGEFRGRVDASGSPSPATVIPRSFSIGRDDSIYLLDVFAGRVLILDPEGKFTKQIDFPKDHEVISDLAVDGAGNVYLIDSVKAMVYMSAKGSGQFSPLTGSMKETMKFPATIATDRRGNIYLADKNGAAIFILGQDGAIKGEQLKMGWTEGLLYYPEQMCINDKEEMFIADRGNNRVQLFSIRR